MDEQELNEYFQKELQKSELQKAQMSLGNQAQMIPQADPGIIKEQLDLGDELKRIDFLLRSYSLVTDPNTGQSKWAKPDNEDLIILTDYGVEYFREYIAWYINKNTLLSNYEEETILDKMRDIAHQINDGIFNQYEKIFLYPSFDRVTQELKDRIKRKEKTRKFVYEILGKEVSEEEITREILAEAEGNIEKELSKIRQKLMKDKLKRFPDILRKVQDTIHSAYLRALGGQERRSIRQNIQITETKGGFSMPDTENKKGRERWFGKK